MRIALKNNDLEVCFKELGGELASIKGSGWYRISLAG